MKKFEYFNQCDRWRIKYDNGEVNWHEMMGNKQSISQDAIELMVDLEGLLDEDEELSEFVGDDPDAGFYKSEVVGGAVFFVQTAGFEFIFTPDGEEPQGINPAFSFDTDSICSPD